ncbi:MAG: Ig-like domain-containing protein, partial [bacterium]
TASVSAAKGSAVGTVVFEVDGGPEQSVPVTDRTASLVLSGLAPGEHTVELEWQDGGHARVDRWSFEVQRAPIPSLDRFDRAELGEAWGVVRDVQWETFDPADAVAEGDVRIEGGELHVASTGGSIGAVLRRVEAPSEFTLSFRARAGTGGAILVQRSDLLLRVELAPGMHDVVLREAGARRSIDVDGARVREWTTFVYHRGGAIGLGVPARGEAWFDDVALQVR